MYLDIEIKRTDEQVEIIILNLEKIQYIKEEGDKTFFSNEDGIITSTLSFDELLSIINKKCPKLFFEAKIVRKIGEIARILLNYKTIRFLHHPENDKMCIVFDDGHIEVANDYKYFLDVLQEKEILACRMED